MSIRQHILFDSVGQLCIILFTLSQLGGSNLASGSLTISLFLLLIWQLGMAAYSVYRMDLDLRRSFLKLAIWAMAPFLAFWGLGLILGLVSVLLPVLGVYVWPILSWFAWATAYIFIYGGLIALPFCLWYIGLTVWALRQAFFKMV